MRSPGINGLRPDLRLIAELVKPDSRVLDIGCDDGALLAYLATRYFGLQSFGLAYGLLFSAFLIGSAIGPVIYGAGFDTTGSYLAVLRVCAGLLVITAFVLQLLPAYDRPARA